MLPTFISGILNITFTFIIMRNIAVVPGLLSLLLTGVLFYIIYHKPVVTPVVAAGTERPAPLPEVRAGFTERFNMRFQAGKFRG